MPLFNSVPFVDIPTVPPVPPFEKPPGLPPLPLPPDDPLFAVSHATNDVDPPPKQVAPNASLELPFTFCNPPLPTLILYEPVGIVIFVAYKTAPPPPPAPI